ncbi:MAG: hypothetical protein AAF848_17055 [Pseudomonadota bacterium]
MKVYAFVPARSGSKGLPNKNILLIDGHPLLAYAVRFGLSLGVDRVILSTDSEEYADIGRRYGAEVPMLRSAAASSDTAMEEDILADFAERLPSAGIPLPDIWIRLKPTNPFRTVESVQRGLDVLKADPGIDSVRIVSPADPRLAVQNSSGFLEPLLADWDPARSIVRRTEMVSAYSPFNLDILRHRVWEELGSQFMGSRIFPIVEHSITGLDVNELDDFEIIRAIIESRPRPTVVKRYLPDNMDLAAPAGGTTSDPRHA